MTLVLLMFLLEDSTYAFIRKKTAEVRGRMMLSSFLRVPATTSFATKSGSKVENTEGNLEKAKQNMQIIQFPWT